MSIMAKGIRGMQGYTLQGYDLLHVDNPDYLSVLQGMKDRLIEISRSCGTIQYKGIKKPKVMGISKQPSPAKIMIDQKQTENVE